MSEHALRSGKGMNDTEPETLPPTLVPEQWAAHYSAVWDRVAHLYPSDAQIGLWYGKGGGVDLVPLRSPNSVWRCLAAHEHADGAYIGVTPRKPTADRYSSGKAKDLYPASVLWLDIDIDKPGFPSEIEAKALIASLPLTPHALIRSGVGFHAYFCLDQLLESPIEKAIPHAFERMAVALSDARGVAFDTSITTQVTRILRPAGTLHRKNPVRPLPVTVLSVDDRPLYSVDEVLAVCPPIEPPRPRRVPGAALRPGDVLAAELPVTEILLGLGWEPLSPGTPETSRWDARCEEAESDNNAETWVDEGTAEQKVIVYSATTASVNAIPGARPMTSFDWLIARCGGDVTLATKLAVRFAGYPKMVLDLIVHTPAISDLADLARQASPSWPEGLSSSDAAYLQFRGVAADVAEARGYRSVSTPVDGYVTKAKADAAPIEGLLIPLAGPKPSSTIRVTTPDADSPSFKSVAYRPWVLDLCPATAALLLDSAVPLVVCASCDEDYPDAVVADAVASAARRADVATAVASITTWTATLRLAGTPTNPSRNDVLGSQWDSVQLSDRRVYLAGRGGWRQQPGLLQLADLLAARGAVVFVLDVCGERDATAVTADSSPWSFGDTLAAGELLVHALAGALPLEQARPECAKYEATDITRGQRLASEFDRLDTYRWDTGGVRWWKNLGAQWAWDEVGGPEAAALEILRRDDATPSSSRALTDALKVAASQPDVQTSPSRMDAVGTDLNVRNGVVDLTTGALRPRNRSEIHTSVCAADFDPSAESPLWQRFLADTFGLSKAGSDDEREAAADLIAYVQRAVGLACIGAMPHELLLACYGPGRNGKSTFWTLISTILGDYAGPADPAILLGHAESYQIAGLKGRRLLVMSETDDGDKLHTASMKRIASNEALVGALKYGHERRFRPTHLPVLLTNHLPMVAATDGGTWRRLKIVPFTHSVSDADEDPTLEGRLLLEADGILAWMVEGARSVLAEGLGSCSIVDAASGQHRRGQDMIGNFLEDFCTLDPLRRTKRSDFCAQFRMWQVEDMGQRKGWSTQSIVRALQEQRGITCVKSSGDWYLQGVALGVDTRNIDSIVQSSAVPDDLSGLPEAVSGTGPAEAVAPAQLLCDEFEFADDFDEWVVSDEELEL